MNAMELNGLVAFPLLDAAVVSDASAYARLIMSQHARPPFMAPRTPDRPMRYNYYALALPDGRWELLSSRQSTPEVFANKDDALQAARHNCRREWEDHGTPFGIRIRDSKGAWIDGFLADLAVPAPVGTA